MPSRQRFRGLTLVEMLIALAITLLMMGAVVNVFANLSGGVRDRRAMIELGSQLRQARELLNRDLRGATCNGLTWQRPDEGRGYLEIVEGVRSDYDPTDLFPLPPDSLVPSSQMVVDASGDPLPTDGMALGDWDDVLALTVRGLAEPYRGRGPGQSTVESNLAEIVWFAVEQDGSNAGDEPGMRRVYRRVLVIAPWVDLSNVGAMSAPDYYQRYDVSAHWDAVAGRWVPNTLGDLTKRENRYFHDATNYLASSNPLVPERRLFPHHMLRPEPLASFPAGSHAVYPDVDPGSVAQGQDLVLNDALAFDVRVYDPGAPLIQGSGATLQPGDAGFYLAVHTNLVPVGYGAYVDLYWNSPWNGYRSVPNSFVVSQAWNAQVGAPNILFAGVIDATRNISAVMHPKSQLDWLLTVNPRQTATPLRTPDGTDVAAPAVVYDTWSFHYEHDGLNQNGNSDVNGNPLVDEGTNGFDDDNQNGVDDMGERETSPPFDVPLRGIQVRLRAYERDARQVREATAVRSFVP